MKKAIKFSLIFVSALFLSACSLQKNPSPQSSTPKEFSLKDLITQNIPQKCTWSIQDDDSKTTAEIIVSGAKFKQTITSESSKNKTVTQAINDGQYLYIWNDDKTAQGQFAMKINSQDSQSDDSVSSTKIDLDQKHQLVCTPTIVSDNDFVAPKDINFTDYNQFLDQLKSSIPNVTIPQQPTDSE